MPEMCSLRKDCPTNKQGDVYSSLACRMSSQAISSICPKVVSHTRWFGVIDRLLGLGFLVSGGSELRLKFFSDPPATNNGSRFFMNCTSYEHCGAPPM